MDVQHNIAQQYQRLGSHFLGELLLLIAFNGGRQQLFRRHFGARPLRAVPQQNGAQDFDQSGGCVRRGAAQKWHGFYGGGGIDGKINFNFNICSKCKINSLVK